MMSAVVIIAGVLAVISLAVVLVQINSDQCRPCDDHVTKGKNQPIDEA